MRKMKISKNIPKISKNISGLCGFLTPFLAFGIIFLSISLHPWFSWADKALSDLGAIQTSYNYVYNIGMVLTGILGCVFALNLPTLMNWRVGDIGVVFFGLGMGALILVGVFPLGTPPHSIVSIGFFSLSTLGMIIIGIDQVISSDWIWGSLILSLVILGLSTVFLITRIPYELGAAIPETIGAIVYSEFSLIYGIRLRYEKNQ